MIFLKKLLKNLKIIYYYGSPLATQEFMVKEKLKIIHNDKYEMKKYFINYFNNNKKFLDVEILYDVIKNYYPQYLSTLEKIMLLK